MKLQFPNHLKYKEPTKPINKWLVAFLYFISGTVVAAFLLLIIIWLSN